MEGRLQFAALPTLPLSSNFLLRQEEGRFVFIGLSGDDRHRC